jgi:hypothetical protein
MPIFASDGQMGVRYNTGDETGFVNSWRGGRMENVTYQRPTHDSMRDALRSWREGTWSLGTTCTMLLISAKLYKCRAWT